MSVEYRILNDLERLIECVVCPYHKECESEFEEPEDNPDGSCRTFDIIRDRKGN